MVFPRFFLAVGLFLSKAIAIHTRYGPKKQRTAKGALKEMM